MRNLGQRKENTNSLPSMWCVRNMGEKEGCKLRCCYRNLLPFGPSRPLQGKRGVWGSPGCSYGGTLRTASVLLSLPHTYSEWGREVEDWVNFQRRLQLGWTSEPSITAYNFSKKLFWTKFCLFWMSKSWFLHFIINLGDKWTCFWELAGLPHCALRRGVIY